LNNFYKITLAARVGKSLVGLAWQNCPKC